MAKEVCDEAIRLIFPASHPQAPCRFLTKTFDQTQENELLRMREQG